MTSFPGTARITDGALGTLIGEYCREAGVRKLKQQLEKIYRKVALRLVKRGASAKVRSMPCVFGNVHPGLAECHSMSRSAACPGSQ